MRLDLASVTPVAIQILGLGLYDESPLASGHACPSFPSFPMTIATGTVLNRTEQRRYSPPDELVELGTDIVGTLLDSLALRVLLELVVLVGRTIPNKKRRVALLLQRASQVGGDTPAHLTETNDRGLSLHRQLLRDGL